MDHDVSRGDEAFLELDDAPSRADPTHDPTPELPLASADEAFLELAESEAGEGRALTRARVLTDDDLKMVLALADDEVPLLAALWPGAPDLLAELPTAAGLKARVDLARTTLNQVTRRGPEWRARAEVAGAGLNRRLHALRKPGSPSPDEALYLAAREEFTAWQTRALEALLRAEAGEAKRVYADGVRRVYEAAKKRGFTPDEVARCAARVGVELLPGEVAAWTPCTALPGEPRTLDGVATALVESQSQGVAALRDGSLAQWLRANRAAEALVATAEEARALANEDDPARALAGLWSVVWALGREGVLIEGLVVTAPETLLGHLRAARLHASHVEAAAPVLARWFRLRGHGGVASACEALARQDPHAMMRLRWSLGDPFRLGERSVADVSALAREVISRHDSRQAALDAWRQGTLKAWFESLPRAKRDALWLDDVAEAPAHEHDETPFWRGLYRRVPRAPLRVHLGEGFEGRVVRFQTVADLRATARLAAVWEVLKSEYRSGELHAWLAVAAPGVEVPPLDPKTDEDVGLHELLAAVGHTGLVIPWGRSGHAVTTPADLVIAWRRGWQQVEAWLAHGHITAWLCRNFPATGVTGMNVARAVEHWGASLGAGIAPPGLASLRLALLCGLEELPLDAKQPSVRGAIRGYRGIHGTRSNPASWEHFFHDARPHVEHGTLALWVARHAPASVDASAWDTSGAALDELVRAWSSLGEVVPTEALATEHEVARQETARQSAEREAARLAAEREAAMLAIKKEAARVEAEREAARHQEELDRARREVEREVSALVAERDAVRLSMEREIARLEAEREAARLAAEREVARARAALENARLAAEREVSRLKSDQEALRLASERRTKELELERDAARREVERLRLTDPTASPSVRPAADAVMREVERRESEARTAAARESERLNALEARTREAAQRETGRLDALEAKVREAAEKEAARLSALEAEARREAAKRAEEAASLARKLAEEAETRAERQRAEEAEARQAQATRDAAIEAAWAARRGEVEREIWRLSDAEAKARRLAASLTAPEETVDVSAAHALEALTEIEGALEETTTPEELAAVAAEVTQSLPERREIDAERVLESGAVTEEGALARVRTAIDAWTHHGDGRALGDLGAHLDLIETSFRPAFEVYVAVRLEARELVFVRPPWREEDVVPVPGEAQSSESGVDPWALDLAEVDIWSAWRAEYLLDTPPITRACTRCDGGKVTCDVCEGGGRVVCDACAGRAKLRCARCAGAGEVSGAKGPERCPRCKGSGDLPCGACTFGRVACSGCEGTSRRACPECDGRGEVRERVAVVQTYTGLAASGAVLGELPEGLAGEVRARNAEPVPVVHIELAEIDPYALAREIPHEALAATTAQMLADETARAVEGQRVVRQRLIVRRYPAYRVRYRFEGEEYALWVHGARELVYADDSPQRRRVASLVEKARASLAAESIEDAIEALIELARVADESDEGRRLGAALGEAVWMMAQRGELFRARDLVLKGARLRWPECTERLVETERFLAQRLQVRSPWVLAEEARAALEKGREDRCIERLAQLAEVDARHAEGVSVARALGARLATQAQELAERGDLAAAERVIASGEAVAFEACREALAEVREVVRAKRSRERVLRYVPAVVALVAVVMAVAGWLR